MEIVWYLACRGPRGKSREGGGVVRQLDDAAGDAAVRQGLHHRKTAAAGRLPGAQPGTWPTGNLAKHSWVHLHQWTWCTAPKKAVLEPSEYSQPRRRSSQSTFPPTACTAQCSYRVVILPTARYNFAVEGEWKYAPDQPP